MRWLVASILDNTNLDKGNEKSTVLSHQPLTPALGLFLWSQDARSS